MHYTVNKLPEDDKSFGNNPRIPQFLATAAVTVGGFGMGNVLGWSSPALPQLALNEDFINLTSSDQSWIGSLATVGAFIAVLPAGMFMERFGRKSPMMISSAFFLIGWLCIVMAQNVYTLYAGRLLTGVGVGTLSLVAPVYLTEISESSVRGMIGVAFQLAIVLGILFSSVVGYLTDWRWLSTVATIVPVIFALALSSVPQSPRFLMKKGRIAEATKAMARLRSSDPDNPSKEVIEELNKIQEMVHSCMDNSISLKTLLSPSLFRPILITLCLILFSQVCGMSAVNFYTVQLFDNAATGLNSYLSTIIVGIVQVAAVLLASLLVDRIGRRILLITSFVLMHISLVSLGLFFYLKKFEDSHPDESPLLSISWLPLSSLILFNIGNRTGVASLVWIVMGEILPSNIIGPVYTLETAYNWMLAFFITRFFAVLNETLEIQNTFWLLAGCCFLGALFVFFMVPETKGKSLEQIQEEHFTTNKPKLEGKA